MKLARCQALDLHAPEECLQELSSLEEGLKKAGHTDLCAEIQKLKDKVRLASSGGSSLDDLRGQFCELQGRIEGLFT